MDASDESATGQPREEKGSSPSRPPKEPGAECGGGAEIAPDTDRRRFLQKLTLSLSGFMGALVAIPWVGFVLSPVLRDTPTAWRAVGTVEDFPVQSTVKVTYFDAEAHPWAGFAAETAAWLRRESEEDFVAFSTYCSHVGCPVRWEEGARLFMCPCHGGAFYEDGSVAAGPPPQPLAQYPVRVRDGTVEIQAVGVTAQRG